MILFFRTQSKSVIATEVNHALSDAEINELCWLYGDATYLQNEQTLQGYYVGPRREMITPWSTNAVEITQNMSLDGILRIEEYFPVSSKEADYDPMLQRMYDGLDQTIFTVNHEPEPIKRVEDLEKFNEEEGLALSPEEMEYLHKIEKQNGRPLTDSEIFGFAQINSEHCRHKIFGGEFIIDGKVMESSLFSLIKKTTKENPGKILSAYKDNVAFAQGPEVEQFAPANQSTSDYFRVKPIESVISLKAETHNFPTTVEPFNGAATGTGGEIRDRMGGGVGSWPIAGTAVYMTAYPRLTEDDGSTPALRDWEDILPVRQWLYQTPEQILIKASNGASDFGNKFGQPLICGSVLTYEHTEGDGHPKYGYDKVNDRSLYGDLMFNINKTLNDFSVSANLGGSFTRNKYNVTGFQGGLKAPSNLFTPNAIDYGTATADNRPIFTDNAHKVNSLFANVELGWRSMLFMTVTGRNDWDSALDGTDNVSFFYPSVGMSAVISQMAKLPSWISYMKTILKEVPERTLPTPANIVEKNIDPRSGLLSGGGRVEYFIKGTEPTRAYVEERGYYVPSDLQEGGGASGGQREELF